MLVSAETLACAGVPDRAEVCTTWPRPGQSGIAE